MSRIKWLQEARAELSNRLARVPRPVAKWGEMRHGTLRTRERVPCSLSHLLRTLRPFTENPFLRADVSAWLMAAEKAENDMKNNPQMCHICQRPEGCCQSKVGEPAPAAEGAS